MIQHELNNGELKLQVKKSPVFVRAVMFLFAFLFFLFPTIGLILSIALGNAFQLGFLIAIGIFGVLGFYLLRLALWNTYGTEIINFEKHIVIYEANYGWFKDGKKRKEISPLTFSIKQIGYQEDNTGILIIGSEDSAIECATKISIDELKKLIEKLGVRNI